MQHKLLGQCHCQAVQFTVELLQGFDTVRRCNCSLCRMRGAIAVSVALSHLHILQGQECLTEYRFNTQQAAHYFCRHCGIYTFHQRRSKPDQYGVNIACLEGISPFDFASVPVLDGVHHPLDGGGGIVGMLTYKNID